MKNDALLKSFAQQGLKALSSSKENFQLLKATHGVSPLDSGQLISIKGGTNDPPPKVAHYVIGN